MSLRRLSIAMVALALAACGTTRPAVSIAPIGLVRVPQSALTAEDLPRTGAGDALRVDFYASPELLTEDGYIRDDTRFCDDDGSTPIRIRKSAPFLGNASIYHPFRRRQVAAERANGPEAAVTPVYSAYVFIARPASPAANQVPAQPAYDLTREPRPICMSLNLREGYEFARTTNTLSFSVEQVAAALRAPR